MNKLSVSARKSVEQSGSRPTQMLVLKGSNNTGVDILPVPVQFINAKIMSQASKVLLISVIIRKTIGRFRDYRVGNLKENQFNFPLNYEHIFPFFNGFVSLRFQVFLCCAIYQSWPEYLRKGSCGALVVLAGYINPCLVLCCCNYCASRD